jgi:malate synthase
MCQRVGVTLPAKDTEKIAFQLSGDSGVQADVIIIDFEDTLKPTFENIINGYDNYKKIFKGQLPYVSSNGDKTNLDFDMMTTVVSRVRGLHLFDGNVLIDNNPISAGLLDIVICFYHSYKELIKREGTVAFYIPKVEDHLEVSWWEDILSGIEQEYDFKLGTLKSLYLIETLPAAFQTEEILFAAKDHAVALNAGRWDRIFSDIKTLKCHDNRVSPDWTSVTMGKYWMDNFARRTIKICHARGALAIGAPAAAIPDSNNLIRKVQVQRVYEDKRNEFSIGHDGCWVSDPYFIPIAYKAFRGENQLDKKLEYFNKYPDLLMDGKGPRTISGLRNSVRVCISYLYSWTQGDAYIALDGKMEDLSTLEISRAQIWQWLYHHVLLDDGIYVTKELVKNICIEEKEKIMSEFLETLTEKPLDLNKIKSDFDQSLNTSLKVLLDNDLRDFMYSYEGFI